MANPKKIPIGRKLTSFPAGTFNQLVEGEIRDRARQDRQPFAPQPQAKSSVIVRLQLADPQSVGAGSVVKLGEAIVDPDKDPSAPFTGLQFKCSRPTSEDEDGSHYAITISPIRANGVGYGHIPQAVWAKVYVEDEGHGFAAIESSALLVSSTSGSYPILWKQSGTGEKWAVVFIGASATARVEGGYAMAVSDINALSAIDGAAFTATPGMNTTDGDSGGVVQLKWNEAGTSLDPVMEDDPASGADPPAQRELRYTAVNFSKTDIRASSGEPVIVAGFIETLTIGEETESRFIITNVMDFRALPGFDSSSEFPQVPHQNGAGADDFTLGSEECEEEVT